MVDDRATIFVLDSSHDFGVRVAERAGLPLGSHQEREFEDGEHKIRSLVNVRNQTVFLIASLYGDAQQSVNDKLCRSLFFLGAIRDACAGRVIAMVPYLCYSRKDRKTKARDPVTTRYVAQLFEAVGINHLITMDVHNLAAFQNAFHQATTDHLEATKLFVHYFASQSYATDMAVVSPDIGGEKRAETFRAALERATGQQVRGGFIQKQRSEGVVRTEALVGDVRSRTVILLDDLISSGTTLSQAADVCIAAGATGVIAAATHGVFSSAAEKNLSSTNLDQIVITNTVTPWRLSETLIQNKLVVLDAAPIFADTIKRVHQGASIVELLEGE